MTQAFTMPQISSEELRKRLFIALLVQERERCQELDRQSMIRRRAKNPIEFRKKRLDEAKLWRQKNPVRWAEIQRTCKQKRKLKNHALGIVRPKGKRILTPEQIEAKRIRANRLRLERQMRAGKTPWQLIKENPEKLTKARAYANAYVKARVQKDPVYRMMRSFRCRLAIFVTRPYRESGMNEMIGCTGHELRAHLESKFTEGMSWATYGKYGWHVDHVKPLSDFNLNDPEQLKLAWHYTNLQPLWWRENIEKNRGRINKSLTTLLAV